MRRRLFLAALLTVASAARAQAPAPRRIVLIGAVTPDLEKRLRELGFVPGRDITIEQPVWDTTAADVRRIVREAVKTRPDVLVTCGALPTQAALEATRTIPIVMVYGADPVVMKLAPGLGRPGGNLTGIAWSASELVAAKAAEIFKEAIPEAKAFAVLGYGENPGARWLGDEARKAFSKLGLRYVDMMIRSQSELELVFRKGVEQGAAGVIVIPDHMTRKLGRSIVQLAESSRLPVLWNFGTSPKDPLLLTFGPATGDDERRAADYVGKILTGTKPGDLPIEQTSRITLGVNLKTAERLGIRLPASLVMRADEVVK